MRRSSFTFRCSPESLSSQSGGGLPYSEQRAVLVMDRPATENVHTDLAEEP